MSDYANDNLFGGWGEQDDRRRSADSEDHDRRDAQAIERADRVAEHSPIMLVAERARVMAMCLICAETAALPGQDFCSACLEEIMGGESE